MRPGVFLRLVDAEGRVVFEYGVFDRRLVEEVARLQQRGWVVVAVRVACINGRLWFEAEPVPEWVLGGGAPPGVSVEERGVYKVVTSRDELCVVAVALGRRGDN